MVEGCEECRLLKAKTDATFDLAGLRVELERLSPSMSPLSRTMNESPVQHFVQRRWRRARNESPAGTPSPSRNGTSPQRRGVVTPSSPVTPTRRAIMAPVEDEESEESYDEDEDQPTEVSPKIDSPGLVQPDGQPPKEILFLADDFGIQAHGSFLPPFEETAHPAPASSISRTPEPQKGEEEMLADDRPTGLDDNYLLVPPFRWEDAPASWSPSRRPYIRDPANDLLREGEERVKGATKVAFQDSVEPYTSAIQQLEQRSADALSTLQKQNLDYSSRAQQAIRTRLQAQQAARESRLQRLESEAEQQAQVSNARLQKFAERRKAREEKLRPKPAPQPAKPPPQPATAPAKPPPQPAANPQPKPAPNMPTPAAGPAPRPAGQTNTQPPTQAPTANVMLEEHARSLELLARTTRDLQGLQCDPQLKADITKRVHLNIIQISAKAEQVRAKIEQLAQTIQIAARGGALLRLYALDLLANKLVSQGETQVSAHSASAFPIAVVATALCTMAPDLTPILVAHFHAACCYTVPLYIPRRQGQTDEEYLVSIGYKRRTSGLETEESYMNRMEGYLCLYAAIMQTDAIGGRPHPHGLAKAWTWMARALNCKPRRITPVLVVSFLSMTGFGLANKYPRQFRKAMDLLAREIIPVYQRGQAPHGPAISRLQTLLNDQFREPPSGRNFFAHEASRVNYDDYDEDD